MPAAAATMSIPVTDTLTGLVTRPAFIARVQAALAGAPGCGTLLLLDLDDFHGVNEAVGHSGGDGVLAEVAARLRRLAPAESVLARLDGDAFGWLLPFTPDDPATAALVDRALAALAAPFDVAPEGDAGIAPATPPTDLVWGTTMCGGMVALAAGATTDDVLRRATLALRRAKRAGPGTVETFTDTVDEGSGDRRALARDLRAAVEQAATSPLGAAVALRLVYQPIVALADERATGVEALLRWHDASRGVVSPALFIPLAEEAGLASLLGRWVLRMACAEITRLNRALERPLTVSVNVSGRQLDETGFPDDVAHALAATLLPPELLVLEVTETALVRDARRARRVLGELRTLGVGVAIDDFGTGYSSLSYLQQLPLDVLKIDRSFVTEVSGRAGPGLTFAKTIVALGQALGLRTVAEGVETAAQRDALRGVGCSHAQGYLFARPLAPPDLAAWLAGPTDGVR